MFGLSGGYARFTQRRPRLFLSTITLSILTYLVVLVYVTRHYLLESSRRPGYNLNADDKSLVGGSLEDGSAQSVRAPHRPLHEDVCSERKNLVFIKPMRSGSTTMLGLLSRFALTHKLSVALPVESRLYHNWPYPMTTQDIRPTSRGGYNILFHHAVYTPNVMAAVMPSDTVYVSIVREPWSQFQSVFRYFNLARIIGLNISTNGDPLFEFVNHYEKYDRVYTSVEAGDRGRWCIPDGFSVSRNLQCHCFGMPLGFPPGTEDISEDKVAVDNYIKNLDRSFQLVMVIEHLYESLVLLRRLMCWKLEDILFFTTNVGTFKEAMEVDKHGPSRPARKDAYQQHKMAIRHKRWSSADYQLYSHFNKTLWRHINRQDSGFHREVSEFKAIQQRVGTFCKNVYDFRRNNSSALKYQSYVEPASEWSRTFVITPDDCQVMGYPYDTLRQMQKDSDLLDSDILKRRPPDKRLDKGVC